MAGIFSSKLPESRGSARYLYLVPVGPGSRRKNSRAHIWTGSDTLCRMAQTAGLNMQNFAVARDPGAFFVCSNCSQARAKIRRRDQ
jgi:hypothetical protein